MNTKKVTEEYFRGRLKGHACDYCNRTFIEGDIIFNPDDERDGVAKGHYFCGALCCMGFVREKST